VGQMADVRITDSYGYSLRGDICVQETPQEAATTA